MKTTVVVLVCLLSAISVHAQRHWGGNMLDPKNDVKPHRPPDAICNDGSLDFEILGRKICGEHKGVRQFVRNQYLGLDEYAPNGVKILTVSLPLVRFVPEKETVFEFWLHPVESDLEKSGKSGKAGTIHESKSIWLIKLKKF